MSFQCGKGLKKQFQDNTAEQPITVPVTQSQYHSLKGTGISHFRFRGCASAGAVVSGDWSRPPAPDAFYTRESCVHTCARFPRSLYPGSSGFGADSDFVIVTLLTSNRWLNTCSHEWNFVTYYFRLSQSFDSLSHLLPKEMLNTNKAHFDVFNSL